MKEMKNNTRLRD